MKTLTHESKCAICGAQLMPGATVPDNAESCDACSYSVYEAGVKYKRFRLVGNYCHLPAIEMVFTS